MSDVYIAEGNLERLLGMTDEKLSEKVYACLEGLGGSGNTITLMVEMLFEGAGYAIKGDVKGLVYSDVLYINSKFSIRVRRVLRELRKGGKLKIEDRIYCVSA